MTTLENETIQIKNLSVGYREKETPYIVANRLNASLHSGELTCLLGANGIGKSTLLRTISAFQPAFNGTILLGKQDIKTYPRSKLATYIGVVLTDRCEVDGMTVYELVSLGRTPYTDFWGKLNEQDIKAVNRSLTLVGIASLAKRKMQTLSDGERQKTMIAKALAQETPVILLDEPTAFLDFPSKVEVMQLLRKLSKETNKSILLSTHDVELALQIADKIWLMSRSEGMITGTPEDLALQNKLTYFFRNDGIAFNEQTGLFSVNQPIKYHIYLIGRGERYAMVQKALIRNGIDTNTDKDSRIVIDITDSFFKLSNNGIIIAESNTIEQLLTAIKGIINKK